MMQDGGRVKVQRAIMTEGFQMEEAETNSQKALSATQIGRIFFRDRATHDARCRRLGSPLAFKRAFSIRGSKIGIDIRSRGIVWARLTMVSTPCP